MDKAEVLDIVSGFTAECQVEMNYKIELIMSTMANDAETRNAMNVKLDSIAKQSIVNHESLVENKAEFIKHAVEEMEKYDEYHANQQGLTDSIKELTDTVKDLIARTADNTAYVQSETYNRRMQESVDLAVKAERKRIHDAQAVIDANKIPWGKWFNTAIPSLIVVAVIGLSSLIWVGITEKVHMEKHNEV